jgi:hypothetical protein
MNKKIKLYCASIIVPMGAIFLNACGPVNDMDNDLALSEASDKWVMLNGYPSEYGRCDDGWDNDGNGLPDSEDLGCHINAGPLRDLSLFGFPEGHNFFPDISKIIPGQPGFPGGFRDRAQITRWFRFLTEPDGNIAATQYALPGVNPDVVPIPSLLPLKIEQGTGAQGNNNNVDLRALHAFYLEHGYGIVGPVPAPPPIETPADAFMVAGTEFVPSFYGDAAGFPGGWPGVFYKGGSQGALESVRVGDDRSFAFQDLYEASPRR